MEHVFHVMRHTILDGHRHLLARDLDCMFGSVNVVRVLLPCETCDERKEVLSAVTGGAERFAHDRMEDETVLNRHTDVLVVFP